MDAGVGLGPDWRDATAYQPLLAADRALFAWEWLRRDREYRAAAERALESGSSGARGDPAEAPERWGLHAFEPPGRAVPDARPIWRAERHPFVLRAGAERSPPGPDSFSIDRLRHFATLTSAQGIERLLLSDGYRSIRLDLWGASLQGGPVRLTYHLSGIVAAQPMILVVRRFLALAARGGYSRSLYPRDPRTKRLVLLLRAFDALQDGADQRTIANELLSCRAAAENRWRVKTPSLRSQAQRLVRAARLMGSSGLWDLLR